MHLVVERDNVAVLCGLQARADELPRRHAHCTEGQTAGHEVMHAKGKLLQRKLQRGPGFLLAAGIGAVQAAQACAPSGHWRTLSSCLPCNRSVLMHSTLSLQAWATE